MCIYFALDVLQSQFKKAQNLIKILSLCLFLLFFVCFISQTSKVHHNKISATKCKSAGLNEDISELAEHLLGNYRGRTFFVKPDSTRGEREGGSC